MFILRTFKTHWKTDNPQSVKITSTSRNIVSSRNKHPFYPFTLLQNYLAIRQKMLTDDEPFFIHADRSGISPLIIRKILKGSLTACGFDHNNFSVHSLRAGRACDLLSYGVLVETIKKLGRWKSNAIYTYLRS